MDSDPAGGTRRFTFRFAPSMAPFAKVFGVRPSTAWVDLGPAEVSARFGRWSMRTPLANVASAEVTGPYAWAKVVGPARLSISDRGATFATNPDAGVCLIFIAPVRVLLPGDLLLSPNLTVTVDDPAALVAAIAEQRVP